MKFIYLINVVDNIHTLLIIALVIFGACAVIRCIGILIGMDMNERCSDKESEDFIYRCKSKMWKFIWAFLGTFLIFCFIPNKHTMYEIFGIGTVIDYVQSNENVKAIPDKCIEAVNLWLDERMKDIKSDNKPEN